MPSINMQAQEILTRVKERDLYSCVVRIPVPQNTVRCDDHMKDLQCKVCNQNDAKLVAVKLLSDKNKENRLQQHKSFKEYILKDLQHIKHEDIWVEVSTRSKHLHY